MISDTLCEAIDDIEAYQRLHPTDYSGRSEDIEAVKAVMGGLMERLQRPPGDEPVERAEGLSPDKEEWWRVTCEANIARWVERLRLLRPVSNQEIVDKLDAAIKQQETLLAGLCDSPDGDCDLLDAPHFHEALIDLLEIVERGNSIPDEIIIEVEDSVEAFVWRTEGLLQTARHCRHQMSESECSQFKVPIGSTYADAARQIEQSAGRAPR